MIFTGLLGTIKSKFAHLKFGALSSADAIIFTAQARPHSFVLSARSLTFLASSRPLIFTANVRDLMFIAEDRRP